MPTTKPTKPSITLPSAFGTSPSNVKTAYTAQELIDGYSASIQQVLDGGNVNWMNDTFFKYMTYTTALCDWLNGTGTGKIPYVNSSNQLDYMDAPTGNIIGQVISLLCTADYIPNGCLPCDGQEYTKAMFGELWTNYLASSPALLPVCTYADYSSSISTYGQCGKFAIDNVNETFKVPTIKDGSYLTQAKSDSELGKSYNESLPNIKGTFSGNRLVVNNSGVTTGAFGVTSGGSYGQEPNGMNVLTYGFDFDASRSSSVYQNNAPVQGNNVRVRYFVVVSNGQQNQAQMDWSAWASSLNSKANKDADNLSTAGKSLVCGLPMPSGTYDILTLGASGTTYTAPASGYFFLYAQYASGTNTYFDVYSNSNAMGFRHWYGTSSSEGAGRGFVLVEKGDTITVLINGTLQAVDFRFIYAKGDV